MPLERDLFVGSAVVTLAYLGESLFGPIAGSIALSFDRPETAGYAFISAAFYGSAVSGFVILLFLRDLNLARFSASALILGSVVNLFAVTAGSWVEALALRFSAGICFGTAVAGVVIMLAQSACGLLLARQFSIMFSVVFLTMTPVMIVVPNLAPQFGPVSLSGIHLLLSVAAAIMIRSGHTSKTNLQPMTVSHRIRETLPMVFWSGRKSVAFSLHAINLFSALLLVIGMQPALAARGVAEVEIGVVLALLNAATFAGGFIHNWISKAYSLTHARWALILSETAALLLAAILLSLDFAFVPVAIGIVLATKGICGGPPTFEAMLYDLGPTDPAASGLQRSLGMMAAIASATAALALAEWLELDILATIIGTLALAYALQLAAFAWLSRALPLTS
ncbi:MAG: hypothetical protein KDA73_07750 [Rhodobacteraceae bacterium]|nr:hypothetical protein [Paracoccaceae bacterium]